MEVFGPGMHQPLAQPVVEGDLIIGYKAGCKCGWQDGTEHVVPVGQDPARARTDMGASLLTECRTSALVDARVHAEKFL